MSDSILRRAGKLSIMLIMGSLLLFACGCSEKKTKTQSPVSVVEKVGSKIVESTSFELTLTPQHKVLGIETVDFGKIFPATSVAAGYAFSEIKSDRDTVLTFGFYHAGAVKIFLNGEPVYSEKRSSPWKPREIAYELFDFPEKIRLHVHSGYNRILVKLVSGQGSDWYFELFPITASGKCMEEVVFTLRNVNNGDNGNDWMCIGAFSLNSGKLYDHVFPPEKGFKTRYKVDGSWFTWEKPPVNMLVTTTIPEKAVYRKTPYVEWNYSNGITFYGLSRLARYTKNGRLKGFVKEYIDFILKNRDFFKWQYQNLHAYRSSFHKLSRSAMLDDTGGPGLLIAEYYMNLPGKRQKVLLDTIAYYIMHKQHRLKDGTFCRPEPVKYTVWADDLFMSVPFLVRMGRISHDTSYYREAVRQILQFNAYLNVPDTNLYKHGWYAATQKQSPVFWGRANGWVLWAETEALRLLPEDFPGYEKVLEIYKKHARAIADYQGKTGLWHQVLNDRNSYEETSCSAIFVFSLASGINRGWLDGSLRPVVEKGWSALTRNEIMEDGTVKDICKGTDLSNRKEYYLHQKTRINDPRGLGAVIMAGIEMDHLKTL